MILLVPPPAMTAADSTKGFGNAKDLQMMATHE
jgi:hypothetical protein